MTENRPKGTAVVVGSISTAAALLENKRDQIAGLLPANVKPERFAKVVLQSIRMNPKLRMCTQASFVEAALQCAQLGLEPMAGQAYLIPRKIRGTLTAQFQLGYQGKKTLAMRSGKYAAVEAHVVRELDEFFIQRGLHPDLKHVPSLEANPGPSVHWYAIAWPKDGGHPLFEHMNKAQVDAIRARSSAAMDGPWVTDYDEMARKTVFSRLAKWLDLEPEVAQAFEQDAIREYGTAAAHVLGHAVQAAVADDMVDGAEMAEVLEGEAEAEEVQSRTATDALADLLEHQAKTAATAAPEAEPPVDAETVARREAERKRQQEALAEAQKAAPGPAPEPQPDPEAGLFPGVGDETPQGSGIYPIRTIQEHGDPYPRWVGDFPPTRKLDEVLERIDNPNTIALMWYHDSRQSVQGNYHKRLAAMGEDPDALLQEIIEAQAAAKQSS